MAWDGESAAEFLTIIDREADKLADMIDQLLDLSRIESDTLRMEPRPQPLAEMISAALQRLAEATAAHALATDIPPDLPPVRADGQRIEQVLANLVDNAAKYSPPGTRIEVAAQRDGGVMRMSFLRDSLSSQEEHSPVMVIVLDVPDDQVMAAWCWHALPDYSLASPHDAGPAAGSTAWHVIRPPCEGWSGLAL